MGLPGLESQYAGLWLTDATPSGTNYAILGRSGETFFNAPVGGNLLFRIGNANHGQVTGGRWLLGPTLPADDLTSALQVGGTIKTTTGFNVNGTPGLSGTFGTPVGITVLGGMVTNIVE